MRRALTSILVAGLAVACQDHGPTSLPAGPQAAISDAAHGVDGNPDFFFLPPMVPNPSADSDFEPAEFNANLSPTVEVCTWSGTACGAIVATFTMSSGLGSEIIRLSTTDQHYAVNWHTDLSNLDPALTYRIRVLVGSEELGFADVDVVSSGGQLKNVNTQEYIGLVDGRTLPIKFRIENAALCDPPGGDCSSASVNLADDVPDQVTLPTGDGVTIPPQNDGGQNVAVTITVQECEDDIDVDLPTFGRCLTITADPRLTDALDPPAIISVCNVDFDVHTAGLSPEQERLVTLHRQSGETIQALPHADDVCASGPVGSAPATGLRGLARAVWGLMGRALATVVEPRVLNASAVVLDVGGGGESDFFSDFQFALPAQMEPLEGTLGQVAAPGAAVDVPPGVLVTDKAGQPVAGATVHFEVAAGNGTITPVEVVSNLGGVAQLTAWLLGGAGTNSVRAYGSGIADPEDEGPFSPNVPSTEADEPVPVGSGEVFFDATARTVVLYGIDAQGGSAKLLTINLSTGAGTVIGNTGVGSLPSLAIDPTTSVFYAGQGGGVPNLWRLDPTTAVATLVGGSGLGFAAIGGLDFGPTGVLYASVNLAGDGGTGADHLATINRATGAATLVGSFGTCTGVPPLPVTGAGSCTLEGMEGIAFDPSGRLWGTLSVRGRSGAPGLYSIDAVTGQATFVAAIVDAAGATPSGGVVSIAFAPDGTLYGGTATAISPGTDGGLLIRIDTATGIFTAVGRATDGSSLTSLAFN